jgi:hypothetical protein
LKNTVCRKIDWNKFVQEYFYTPNAPLYGGLVPGDAARSFVLELKSVKRRNEVTDQREERM